MSESLDFLPMDKVEKPLVVIDVRDEIAFRAGVVQYLQFVADRCEEIPALKATVESHEKIVTVGKWAAWPVMAAFHIALKHLPARFGF